MLIPLLFCETYHFLCEAKTSNPLVFHPYLSSKAKMTPYFYKHYLTNILVRKFCIYGFIVYICSVIKKIIWKQSLFRPLLLTMLL